MADYKFRGEERAAAVQAMVEEAIGDRPGFYVERMDVPLAHRPCLVAFWVRKREREFGKAREAVCPVLITHNDVYRLDSLGRFRRMVEIKVDVALREIRRCRHERQKVVV